MEAKGWEDERLLQAVALQAYDEKDKVVQLLFDALALAEPDGFIRIFVDEGIPMAQLLSEAAAHGMMPDYIGKLLAVCEAEEQKREDTSSLPPAQTLLEPLSRREVEVLHLTCITGAAGWLMWAVVHILFLIGFRNRYLTVFQWAWNYLTFDRGARLVSCEDEREELEIKKLT